jgi:F-type H+-transporting ATPase subunit gamma
MSMANNMRAIKQKIRSFNKTKQITKAMKMVSSVALRRAQERAVSARPYAEKMRDVIISLAQGTGSVNHPMLVSRPVKKTGYLVITSDRGLAGGYNSNLLRLLLNTLREKHASNDEFVIFTIGRKGTDFLKKRGLPVLDSITGLSDHPNYADVKGIAKKAVSFYSEEKYDELYLVYNEFINPVTQRPVVKRLLPLAGDEFDQSKLTTGKALYEFEPSEEEVLNEILPRYAETLIFSALLDAKASEHASRMNAMSNATDNAQELIDKLILEFNRARQATITQEIAEIVGAASAISG